MGGVGWEGFFAVAGGFDALKRLSSRLVARVDMLACNVPRHGRRITFHEGESLKEV